MYGRLVRDGNDPWLCRGGNAVLIIFLIEMMSICFLSKFRQCKSRRILAPKIKRQHISQIYILNKRQRYWNLFGGTQIQTIYRRWL